MTEIGTLDEGYKLNGGEEQGKGDQLRVEEGLRTSLAQGTDLQGHGDREEDRSTKQILEQKKSNRSSLNELDMNVGRESVELQDTKMIVNNGKWKRIKRTENSGNEANVTEEKENMSHWGLKREWHLIDVKTLLPQEKPQSKKGRLEGDYHELDTEMVEEASPKWPQLIQ